MAALVDIVNFNADASCLDAAHWLACLEGGEASPMCRWLSLYVRHRKPVVLGITGATVSDLRAHDPASVALIRNHPEIFQIVLRPYAHDIPLMRTPVGFRFNLAAGTAAIRDVFGRATSYYLPPEFMLMSDQVRLLAEAGVTGTFINAQRYETDLAERIPTRPYRLRGVLGSSLGCLPIDGDLTRAYLRAIQLWDGAEWSAAATPRAGDQPLRLWRDGESPFLIPDGIEREEHWLTHCTLERRHLGEEEFAEAPAGLYQSYPVHSCSAWMKEFRMLGYLTRIAAIEAGLAKLSPIARGLWLAAINSDVLSSFEKQSPLVQIREAPSRRDTREFRIARSERGYEGEEYLALLDRHLVDGANPSELERPVLAHLIKIKCRLEHLQHLESVCSDSMSCS